MFTGLVEKTGKIESLIMTDSGRRLTILHEEWKTPISVGESISVQGACLTALKPSPGRFEVDLLQETVDRTSLSQLGQHAPVNLERALAVGDRLGGHFVTGHVDGLAEVVHVEHNSGDVLIHLTCSTSLLAGMVPKGSICIDGVSLTIAGLTSDGFHVCLIPHTLEITSLSVLKPGQYVNIETDIIGKHVARYMEHIYGKQAD
jgi:riboflavin synthase